MVFPLICRAIILCFTRLREFVWVSGCVTALAAWVSGPSALASRGHGVADVVGPVAPPGRASGRGGVQKSVHRSTKMVSRSCFGAFVYTVAALRTGVVTQECTQIGENGTSEPFWAICVHCCDASCVGWHERPNCHGVPAVPPRCPASPLAGKTGSARVAPPLGWRFHRGVNPHKPPKSLFYRQISLYFAD